MIFTNAAAPAKPVTGIVGKNPRVINFTITEEVYKRELKAMQAGAPKKRKP